MRLCETNALCVDLHQSSSTTDWNSVSAWERGERRETWWQSAIRAQETGWEREREREWCSDKFFTLRVCLVSEGKRPPNINRIGQTEGKSQRFYGRLKKKTQNVTHLFPSLFLSFPGKRRYVYVLKNDGNSGMREAACPDRKKTTWRRSHSHLPQSPSLSLCVQNTHTNL